MRCFSVFCLLVLPLYVLPVHILPCQEMSEPEAVEYKTFPAALLFETAGIGFWQPNWPPGFPPDAFLSESAVSITFLGCSLKRAKNNDLLEFPWFLEGELVQVNIEYSDENSAADMPFDEPFEKFYEEQYIKSINIGEFAVVDILEYKDKNPYLLRIFWDDFYYFVYFLRTRGMITETWYDRDGNFLDQYEYYFLPGHNELINSYKNASGSIDVRRSFDSRFLVTGIFSLDGEFSANYYKENLPRYWNYRAQDPESEEGITGPRNFSFQWDENDFLVRFTEENGPNRIADSRYEYTLDEKGNWIERRETRMIRLDNGLLVPVPGSVLNRVLEYEEE